jgi:cytochrome P450
MLADPSTYAVGVPHDEFARRRREAPVAWVEEPALPYRGPTGDTQLRHGPGFWAVTRHADVVAASRAPAVFSSAAKGAFLSDPRTTEDLERARQLLVNMDAPEHARVRRYLTEAFTAKAVQTLTVSIQRHADAVVGRVRSAGGFDAVADLAAELPLLVLADLLGVPRADRGLLLRWSNNLVGFDDPAYGGGDVTVYRETFREAFAYARQLAQRRRREPGDDLVSRLVTATVDGRCLTDAEFCQLWLLLVIAGNETTRHLISGGLLALAQSPDQLTALAADPALTPVAVEELLRWVTPIMQFRRTAVVDTDLAGQPVRAGDKVVIYYISANRDETVFDEPGRLRLDRRPNPHVAFGAGPHFCLGWQLAHAEARSLLDALRPCLPRLRVAGPAVRLESNFMNGLRSLPLTVDG